MKIDFNPVSFKANGSAQVTNGTPVETNPLMEALNLDNEHAAKSKSKVELFNYRLHDDNWSKTYEHSTNTLRVKFPNCYDGTEYNIYPDGRVVESNGWTSPSVIIDKHEELSKYVEAMKDYQTKLAGTFVTNPQQKSSVGFGAGTAWEGFTNPANAPRTSAPVQAQNTGVENSVAKVDVPEQKVDTPADSRVVNKQMEALQTPEPAQKQKTTFKEKIANVWKFFTTLGRMTTAVFKGIGYGAATAASLLAGSWLFNTLPKAFSKEGPKFAQILKHPIKNISKSGKIIAGIGAAAVFAYHLIAGKLSANQRTAVIDHKLHVGHRDV